MTSDELELELLQRAVEQHALAERIDPLNGDKCMREVDLRAALEEITGLAGSLLDYQANLWLARLAPLDRLGPKMSGAPLRRCSNRLKNQGEHRYNVRAFLDPASGLAMAWDRIRELTRLQPVEPQSVDARGQTGLIRLFISHGSGDRELASKLIQLVRSALSLTPGAIRCTSVDGYRLSAGANTDEELKREVHDADAFVGIVSADSVRSLYVLFELGARWGASKQLIPLLAPGAKPDLLGGPLGALNALKMDNRSQMHQLVTDLATVLKVNAALPSSYQEQIDALIAAPKTAEVLPEPAVGSADTPPKIQVEPYGGTEVILYVSNSGGDATFTAEAQIVNVSRGVVRHRAPYLMLWRDPTTHKTLAGHSARITSGNRLKLLVAEWQTGGDWGKPSFNVIGDRSTVDSYRRDDWEKPGPLVTVEVRISASPALLEPFVKRFAIHMPARSSEVVQIDPAIP